MGRYESFAEAKAAESALLASGRYLANVAENEDNPCRWDFGPTARTGVVAGRARARRPVWRRRWFRPAVLAGSWLALTVLLWAVAGARMPGWSGLRSSVLTVSALFVLVWWLSRPRRSRRRRR